MSAGGTEGTVLRAGPGSGMAGTGEGSVCVTDGGPRHGMRRRRRGGPVFPAAGGRSRALVGGPADSGGTLG
ncbi:hypothetical protein GCM10010293_66120 [Streptomyces griseoflavus]|nr:hypothetical protein GCM10010293_66120 [Streptomyces griseoflavus]